MSYFPSQSLEKLVFKSRYGCTRTRRSPYLPTSDIVASCFQKKNTRKSRNKTRAKQTTTDK